MSLAAILGAGPIGSAIAHRLAERARFRAVRLIDAKVSVAAGKALDIRQSGPIDGVDVDLSATDDVLAATGASAIVVADAIETGEWQGETGLALVRQLARAGTNAPLVFAGPDQIALMETVAAEVKWPSNRLIGSAAGAVPAAVRALVGIELGRSGADVDLVVVGRPPGLVIGWSSATASGSLVTEQVAAHRLRAISDGIGKLWPPGPQAIGAATAAIAEALAFGSRRLHQALTISDGEFTARGRATLLPLELGGGRILRRVMPTLSAQERTGSDLFFTESAR
jgi:malate dehydrogenase